MPLCLQLLSKHNVINIIIFSILVWVSEYYNLFDLFYRTMSSCHFTACIVDEAGQSIEPLSCVPVLLGIDKLILVGDDKQLEPLIKSKVSCMYKNKF